MAIETIIMGDGKKFHISRVGHPGQNGSGSPSKSSPGVPRGGIFGDMDIGGDYNPEMKWPRNLETYDRMRRSDAQVRASLALVKAPVVSAQWYVQPASDSPLDREVAKFVFFNMNQMHRPWVAFVHEALGMLDFGHYLFVPTYERAVWRQAPTDESPRPHYKVVTKWEDMSPRHPRSISEWNFNDSDGSLRNVAQQINGRVEIPADRLVIFTMDEEGDDPRGTSVLRSAYPHWYYKQGMYKVDAMQKERHGMGIPDVEYPVSFGDKEIKMAEDMAANLRANEKAYVTHPPGFIIKFLKPEGNLVDVLETAQHHGLMILQNVLVQFLSLGSQESGSRAVGNTQLDAFQRATRYLADIFRGVVNQELIPRLVDYNYEVDAYPELRVRRLGEDAELKSLAGAFLDLAKSGVLQPDTPLEAWLRDWADLPMMSQEAQDRTIEERVTSVSESIKPPAPTPTPTPVPEPQLPKLPAPTQ